MIRVFECVVKVTVNEGGLVLIVHSASSQMKIVSFLLQ